MTVLTANPVLPAQVAASASAAGLQVLSSSPAISSSGAPTTRFELALGRPQDPGPDATTNTFELQLSDSFDAADPAFAAQLKSFLDDSAQRLRNRQPNTLLTLTGIPLAFSAFEWPFHESTAGADTSLVHGLVTLADGTASPLHAKIAAAMTITFREVVAAPEQPFAESFILNAIRKTFDQGQLELVKSGNRQPVPVTTRYYSSKSKKFVFNDTTETQRQTFLAAKTFWLSGVLGTTDAASQPAPVWLLDPRDAQYLNTTVDDLHTQAQSLVQQDLIAIRDGYAAPTVLLMARAEAYRAQLAEALAFIKPTFNEDMRAGNTNM